MPDPTLSTPLLSSSSSDEVHIQVPDPTPTNPFSSLGAAPLSLPPPCPIDPFRNHTRDIRGVYEWVKIVLCLPIAVVRLVAFGLALLLGFVATKVALLGWKDRRNPMPRWRCRIMWVTRVCARCILFSFGYHWIRRIGKPASREIAPIVVSNHVSYVEPIFFFYELFPTMVASESHDSIPLVGTIIRAMQVIYVDRFSPSSRKYAVSEIKRKASSNDFPRVILFSEGTTTNGRVLISFQLGAFIPGLPIQPVVVRYPHVHFDQSWGHISLGKLMFRMFTQFHNFMEVEYLPVVNPPVSKFESATHFSAKTSFAIANALNVVQTCHTYGDLMLMTKASEHAMSKPSAFLVEMGRIQSTYNISTSEALKFLEKFIAMSPDHNGHVQIENFLASLKLGSDPLALKIFDYVDVEKKGFITFREFLIGCAQILNQPSFHSICEVVFDAYTNKLNCYLIQQKVGGTAPVPQGTYEESVIKLLHSLNVGKDNVLTKNDFMTFMRNNPLLVAYFVDNSGNHTSFDILQI